MSTQSLRLVRGVRSRNGHRVRRAVLGAIGVLLLVFAALTLQYRSTDWWWGPGRVHLMGRDYDRESESLTRTQADLPSPAALHVVGHLPLGQTFEAVRPDLSVPTVLYLHEWDDHYVVYVLSGGP